jgi:hypothetical protein
VHPRQSTNDFKMAELFGADIHQQIFQTWIVAIEALNRVFSGKLSIGSSKLLEKHFSKSWIGFTDVNGYMSFFT